MYKGLLTVSIWVLFLGGLFGFAAGMILFLGDGSPAEYGVMGIGGGFYLLAAGVCTYYRERVPAG